MVSLFRQASSADLEDAPVCFGLAGGRVEPVLFILPLLLACHCIPCSFVMVMVMVVQ
jgi:hypothetical protein